MSHEIRGYVTKMKAGLRLVFEENYGKINQEAQSFINTMYRQSEDFGDLVEEFLDISHLEQDIEIQLKIDDNNIIDILKGVVGDLSELLLKKNISVVYEGNVPEKIFLPSDSSKISRVFSNILTNAIKYSKEDTSVRIGYIESEGMHTFYIKDTGIGIPTTEQASVFKKFYRATNARSLHFAGTGLGMYFSKLIVERHGGKIWFESTERIGTTFFVSLPKKIQE
jgi:signal transduction histidine kinase